jgi:hypothetical protein
LKPGDSLFVYTDGVAEATDVHNQLFGAERMLDALNRDRTPRRRKRLSTYAKPSTPLSGRLPSLTISRCLESGTSAPARHRPK